MGLLRNDRQSLFTRQFDFTKLKEYNSFRTIEQCSLKDDEKRVKIFKTLAEVKRIEMIRYLREDTFTDLLPGFLDRL